MSGPGRVAPARSAAGSSGGLELVLFRVGPWRLAVPRDQVKGIRPSPRVQGRIAGVQPAGAPIPIVSLSEVLGLQRDTATDRRVLEVEHWGQRLGIEVTAIEGIRTVRVTELHLLPAVAQRNCASAQVLGLVIPEARASEEGRNDPDSEQDELARLAANGRPAVALDLTALLVEQGVEVEAGEPTS